MIFSFIYKAIRQLIIKDLIKVGRKKFCKCGSNVRFSPHNSYFTYGSIEVGNNVFINTNAYLSGSITIGDNVLFGPYVIVTNGHHTYDAVGKYIYAQGRPEKKAILIEQDSWVGARSIILQSAGVGEGSVIGAGSTVTKKMPPYCICFGNPCKPVKYRYSDDELREHFRLTGRSIAEAEQMIVRRREMLNGFTDGKL